jgi:hypothetical protein
VIEGNFDDLGLTETERGEEYAALEQSLTHAMLLSPSVEGGLVSWQFRR